MIGLAAIVVCFTAAVRLHDPWSTFAFVCGVVQTISFLTYNAHAQYERNGGKTGSGDGILIVLLGTAGWLGTLTCLVLLLVSAGR